MSEQNCAQPVRELSVLEYANPKGIGVNWVYLLIRQKKIAAIRRDGRWFIPVEQGQE
jgi:hypothetical protein